MTADNLMFKSGLLAGERILVTGGGRGLAQAAGNAEGGGMSHLASRSDEGLSAVCGAIRGATESDKAKRAA